MSSSTMPIHSSHSSLIAQPLIAQNHCGADHQSHADCSQNTAEIIRLVKQTAASLSSPPRIYASAGEQTSSWPGYPGTYLTEYGTCGIQPLRSAAVSCALPLALVTSVEPISDGSYNVTLQSHWTESGQSQSHAWKFHVSRDHQVTFAGEIGDQLPSLRM